MNSLATVVFMVDLDNTKRFMHFCRASGLGVGWLGCVWLELLFGWGGGWFRGWLVGFGLVGWVVSGWLDCWLGGYFFLAGQLQAVGQARLLRRG